MEFRPLRASTLFVAVAVGSAAMGAAIPPAYAQNVAPATAAQGQISAINVSGNQRIERQSVLSLAGLQPGDRLDPARLNNAVKELYASQLFSDVQITRSGSAINILLVENPIANEVAFEGNYAVNDEILAAETRVGARDVVTNATVKADVSRILAVYRATGLYDVNVRPVIITLPQNRVNLVYEVTEGPRSKIKSIGFIGNRAYTDRRLRNEIISRQDAFWRFISGVTGYDPDRIRADEEVLRAFYRDRGYADMEVESSIGEFRENDRSFAVTLTVDEGPRYRIGRINVNNSIPGVSADDVRKLVSFKRGAVYSASDVDETISEISDSLGDQGYAFVDIEPKLDRRDTEKGKVVDVTFVINEADKVYVERVNITGNTQTLDRVIRREMLLAEGDAFSVSKIRDSRSNIESLNFFGGVRVANRRGSAPDKTVIDIEVQEKPTGSLEFGGAYSSSGGPSISFGLSQDNLLGRGTALDIDVNASQTSRSASLSVTEPYLFGRNMTGGVSFGYSDQEVSSSGYREFRLSSGLTWGYRVNQHLSQSWGASVSYSDIDPGTTTALAIIDEQGATLRAIASHNLAYTRLDSRINPRSGVRVVMSNQYAGFGADVDYFKNSLTLDAYVPIGDNFMIASRTVGGILTPINESSRITDRYSLGGAQVRGFSSSGIGPRLATTNESLGGSKFYYGNLEMRAKIPLPLDLEIEGRAFVDAGSVWDISANYTGTTECTGGVTTNCYYDGHSVRASAGLGFSWDSPLGPLQIDYGWPIQSEDHDIVERFRFNIGTRF